MLVLSRNKDQSIVIGDNVEVTIVEVCGNKVRLGIIAPIDITIYRKEVALRIQKEKNNEAVCTIQT